MIAPSAEDLAKVKELAVSLPSSLLKTALLDAVAEYTEHEPAVPPRADVFKSMDADIFSLNENISKMYQRQS